MKEGKRYKLITCSSSAAVPKEIIAKIIRINEYGINAFVDIEDTKEVREGKDIVKKTENYEINMSIIQMSKPLD